MWLAVFVRPWLQEEPGLLLGIGGAVRMEQVREQADQHRAGGVLRTSTPPTLNCLLLLRASV